MDAASKERLGRLVDRMIAAKEPDEKIAQVIQGAKDRFDTGPGSARGHNALSKQIEATFPAAEKVMPGTPIMDEFGKKPWYSQLAALATGNSPFQTQEGTDEGLASHGVGPGSPEYKAMQEADEAKKAAASMAAGGVAGSGLAGLLGMAAPKMGIAARLATGGLSATAAGGATGGVSAAQHGEPIIHAIKEGALGDVDVPGIGPVPVPVLGLAGTGIGEASGGLRKLLGKDRWIGRYQDANDAGRLERARELPSGGIGMRQAAEEGAERVFNRDRAITKEEGTAFREGEAALPSLDEPMSVADVHRRLNRAVDRFSNQSPVRPKVERLIEDTKDNLRNITRQRVEPVMESDVQTNVRPVVRDTLGGEAEGRSFEPDPSRPGNRVVALAPGEEIRTPSATPRDLLKTKRSLKKSAQFGQPSTGENEAPREIYETVKDAVNKAVPEHAVLDERYSKFRQGQDIRREILKAEMHPDGMQRVPETDLPMPGEEVVPLSQTMNITDKANAATNLARIGDTNVPGLRMSSQLKVLAAQDPEFAAALSDILDKKALEAVRPGLHAVMPTDLHGVTEAFGVGQVGKQNARAVGAHAIDPALKATANTLRAPGVSVLTALSRAQRKRMEEENRP
jgi:hypothetical protein